MRRSLYRVLEDTSTPVGRLVDLLLLVLIIASIVGFAWSTIPDVSPSTERGLELFQLVAVAIFTLEYLLRLIAAGGKPDGRGASREALAYALSFYGVIDLLAILPFYLNLGGFIALRSLRILRLLRLFKIGRYSRSLSLFATVLRDRSSQLGVFMYISFIFIFIAATGIYYCEHGKQPEAFSSIPMSLWWAVVTLTTVGYGDAYPITAMGKLFTSAIVILSLGVIAIPTGIISAGMVEAIGKVKSTQSAAKKCPTCGRPYDDGAS